MKPEIDLSHYSKNGYTPGRSTWIRGLWYMVNCLFFICPLSTNYAVKRTLLRWFGAHVGRRVIIKPGVNIKYPWFLTIGDNTWIGERVWIDNLAKVEIGNNVCLSQGAMIECGNHDYTSPNFDLITNKIEIADGAWVGAQAMVLAPCSIHKRAVLLSGSVATGELQSDTIYQGHPAEKKKDRVIVEKA